MNEVVRASTSFSGGVTRLLQHVVYRRAESADDLLAIQRLRYEANLREGAITPNESRKLLDRFDDSPNGFNVGLYIDGRLASALRLHFLSRDYPDPVLHEVYPDVVSPLVASGMRIIDITRLVADFDLARKHPHLAYATVRLSMLASEHFGAQLILAAVRREHIPFYQREFMATKLTEPRPYPTLVKPLSLFQIDYAQNRDAIIGRHAFHASTEAERRAIFGDPNAFDPG